MKTLVAILPLALSLALPACGQRKSGEAGITRDQADEIIKELRQIRQLLEKGAKPGAVLEAGGRVRMNLEGSDWLGSKDAPLTMVEFTDYQCTFCQKFHLATFPEIRKKYIDTGKLRFASRDLPLEFHSNAARAAEAGRCAADQGRFWPMRDKMVANAEHLAAEDVTRYARELGLNLDAFSSCLSSGKHKDEVEKDVALALSLNINGTPGFIIGKSTPEGVEGSVLLGAVPLDAFELKLKELAR
jgi:protein-disulfide isomerase